MLRLHLVAEQPRQRSRSQERTAPSWTADQASGPCWRAADRPLSGKRSEPLRSRPWDEPQTGPRLGHDRGRARTAFRSETEARLNISLPLLSRRTRHHLQIAGGEIEMSPQPMRHKRSQGRKERSVQTSASQGQNQPADQQKKSTAFPCATGASLPLGR